MVSMKRRGSNLSDGNEALSMILWKASKNQQCDFSGILKAGQESKWNVVGLNWSLFAADFTWLAGNLREYFTACVGLCGFNPPSQLLDIRSVAAKKSRKRERKKLDSDIPDGDDDTRGWLGWY